MHDEPVQLIPPFPPVAFGPQVTPAVFFAATAPESFGGFTWNNPEPRPQEPKVPPGLSSEQIEQFTGWCTDGIDIEDITDAVVLMMIRERKVYQSDLEIWVKNNRMGRETAWRWHWAKEMIKATPIEFMFSGIGHVTRDQADLHDFPGIRAALVERKRQVEVKGYTAEHDDEHTKGEIAAAAAFYAVPLNWEFETGCMTGKLWPKDWIPPHNHPDTIEDRQIELAKAMAMLGAEWERLERLKAAQ